LIADLDQALAAARAMQVTEKKVKWCFGQLHEQLLEAVDKPLALFLVKEPGVVCFKKVNR
jgi:hypothetical protein